MRAKHGFLIAAIVIHSAAWALSLDKMGHDQDPLDVGLSQLPKGYEGNDWGALLKAGAGIPVKQITEKTEDHKKRVAEYRAKTVYGRVSLDDLVAVRIGVPSTYPKTGATYNADTEEFSYFITREYAVNDRCHVAIKWINNKQIKSYTGQNSFGVKKNIKVIKRVFFSVNTGCEILDKPEKNYSFKLPPKDVRSALGGYVLLIGHLADQPSVVYEQTTSPTMTSPAEIYSTEYGLVMQPEFIWYVDSTGKVLDKQDY